MVGTPNSSAEGISTPRRWSKSKEEGTLLLFLAARGPKWTLSGLASEALSSTDAGR